VFVEASPPQESFGGNWSGNLRKLLDRVGNQVGRRFVDESQTPGELKIEWRDHLSWSLAKLGQEDGVGGAALDRLLENLSTQTSLRFRREMRTESVWLLTRVQ
jgi:hypothetical protein